MNLRASFLTTIGLSLFSSLFWTSKQLYPYGNNHHHHRRQEESAAEFRQAKNEFSARPPQQTTTVVVRLLPKEYKNGMPGERDKIIFDGLNKSKHLVLAQEGAALSISRALLLGRSANPRRMVSRALPDCPRSSRS